MEGFGSVFGEFEYASYGVSREKLVFSLCVGSVASLLIGSLLGILGDLIDFLGNDVIYVTREWTERPPIAAIGSYKISFSASILGDKQIWLLAWAQACLQFSIMVFWILWAPTIVAYGREVKLGMMYPCFMGARVLGSTAVPWFTSGPSPVRCEDYLLVAFIFNAIVLSIVAYDYQEIRVLVTLFCVFHAGVGLILPSLARLRTIYVPNELRGGMISLSNAPANAAMVFVLIQGGTIKTSGMQQ